MPNMLSPHFSEEELGVVGCDPRIIDNAKYICLSILEPIREHFASPISVHDGYRDHGHNTRVGGAATSFHLFDGGKSAVDIDVSGYSCRRVFDWLRLESHLPFDKVIVEANSANVYVCVHIQVDRNNSPRRQSFTGKTNGGGNYTLVETR